MTEAQHAHARQLRVRLKLKYEGDCTSLYKTDCFTAVGYDDVPWPCRSEVAAASGESLRNAVVDFLFGEMDRGTAEYRSYLRVQRVRWHPDRFAQRCGHRLATDERERILRRVKEISQILNELHRQLEQGSS